MKSFKKLLCAGLTLAVMSSAMAFAGCTGSTAEEPQRELTYQEATYQKYRAYAEAMGDEVLTYEEWLESIKGEDGKDGTSWLVGIEEPLETLGKNGDFYLNTENFDLYRKSNNAWSRIGNIKGAKGDKGETGAKGDQGLKGDKGEKGDDGADGTKWFTGTEANPADDENAAQAKEGEFYFNTEEFELWQKSADGWNFVGKLAREEKVNSVTVEQGQTATVPLVGVEQGWNYVYADLGDATLDKDTNLQAYIGSGKHSAFIKSEEQSAEGKNVYFGLVNVTDGASELTLAAAEQSVTASISFKSLNGFTIKNGVTFETAITKDGSFKLELDDTMLEIVRNRNSNNKIKWTINIDSNGYIASLIPLDSYASIDFTVSANCGFAPIALCQQITDKTNFNKTSTISDNFNVGDKYLTITSSVGDDLIHPCILKITFETVDE